VTTLDVLFGAVALITAASAVLAVTTQHLVHAALWLVVTLGTLAGCYLVLGAELVALVQLVVYVGAVVVLVLFALMLTRAPIGRSPEHSSRGAADRVSGGRRRHHSPAGRGPAAGPRLKGSADPRR